MDQNDIPNSPELIQFLAASLSSYIALNRHGNRRWTLSRVASYISTSETIEGTLSDTTLGRFLDPACPQAPSDNTVGMIAAFVLEMRVISKADLELVGEASGVKQALHFNTFFETPDTQAFHKFLNTLSGQYFAVNALDRLLLTARLIIECYPGANIATVSEIFSLYHSANLEPLRARTANFSPQSAIDIDTILSEHSARREATFVNSGSAITKADIAAFICKAKDRGFSSIFNVNAIIFNDDDMITGLKGTRNSGWISQEPGEIFIPDTDLRSANPLRCVKALSSQLEFRKIPRKKRRSPQKRKAEGPDERVGQATSRSFTGWLPDDNFLTVNENFSRQFKALAQEDTPPDQRLLMAIEWEQFEAFVTALSDGAGPNSCLSGQQNPIIFGLAANGKLPWVEALVRTGHCDLTRTDQAGCRPSHYPGVTARRLAAHSSSQPDALRFANVFKFLNEQELLQLQAKAPGPLL